MSSAAQLNQVIRADECYTIPEFRRRADMGDYSFRGAKAAGLKIIKIGRKHYVRGADWLAFLENNGK